MRVYFKFSIQNSKEIRKPIQLHGTMHSRDKKRKIMECRFSIIISIIQIAWIQSIQKFQLNRSVFFVKIALFVENSAIYIRIGFNMWSSSERTINCFDKPRFIVIYKDKHSTSTHTNVYHVNYIKSHRRVDNIQDIHQRQSNWERINRFRFLCILVVE